MRRACAARPPNASSGLAMAKSSSDPSVAAVLSFFIPGVGQIYNGAFLRGIFWLIVTPGLWIGSGGTLGWICHLIFECLRRPPPADRRLTC